MGLRYWTVRQVPIAIDSADIDLAITTVLDNSTLSQAQNLQPNDNRTSRRSRWRQRLRNWFPARPARNSSSRTNGSSSRAPSVLAAAESIGSQEPLPEVPPAANSASVGGYRYYHHHTYHPLIWVWRHRHGIRNDTADQIARSRTRTSIRLSGSLYLAVSDPGLGTGGGLDPSSCAVKEVDADTASADSGGLKNSVFWFYQVCRTMEGIRTTS